MQEEEPEPEHPSASRPQSSTPEIPAPNSPPPPAVEQRSDATVDVDSEEGSIETREDKRAPRVSESCSSEECDDSGDEDFSPESDADGNIEEPSTAESAASEDEDEDISIYLMDSDYELVSRKPFKLTNVESGANDKSAHAVGGPYGGTDSSAQTRSRPARKVSLFPPFRGRCVQTYYHTLCYGVVPLTIQRYKTRIRDGNIALASHGNKLNKHAAQVDVVWLVKWFKEFAEVVPVRVRMQKKIDSTVQIHSSELYTLLLAHFTWDSIYDESHKFVEAGLKVREPARFTMRKLLTLHCPTIRIRSSRSNVYDICAIYQLGCETVSRRIRRRRWVATRNLRMRREYKKDQMSAADDHAVLVMDFSENLTIPSVAQHLSSAGLSDGGSLKRIW